MLRSRAARRPTDGTGSRSRGIYEVRTGEPVVLLQHTRVVELGLVGDDVRIHPRRRHKVAVADELADARLEPPAVVLSRNLQTSQWKPVACSLESISYFPVPAWRPSADET